MHRQRLPVSSCCGHKRINYTYTPEDGKGRIVTSGDIPQKAALIIVDVQRGLDDIKWGKRNNKMAERNIQKMLWAWRSSGRPVFHIKHMSKYPESPLREGKPGNEIKEEVRPTSGEPVIMKNVNSAFIGTDLEKRLRDQRIGTVIITGLVTDHCVSTTARMAGNLGFRTFVVADATATFNRTGFDGKKYTAEEIHQTALASLKDEFAEIVETKDILGRLQES